ncbi:hypothetical protein DNX69_02055 [Rhodopseudomonas palustris]|uniref:O-antigen ligase domain-containing protein n=2 Tax=Rhodopseudomonas palustris TaxID=1076 RepID=A0A323ULR0_RHOPL|nr:hypothetical protein DNX69_02055 [Rhodopseudomonas palustris]
MRLAGTSAVPDARSDAMPNADVPLAGEPLGRILLTFVVALTATACSPLLHVASPMLAITVETLVAIAIAIAMPAQGPVIAIFLMMFQNVFVSLFSPLVTEPSELEFLKGYNFLICAVLWLVAFARAAVSRRSPMLNRLLLTSTAVLAVMGVYFVIGLTREPKAAAIYLRNIALPVLLFQLALLAAANHRIRVTPYVVVIAVLVVICGGIEFAFRDAWLDITNGHAYWRLEEIKATNSGVWEREMRATGKVIVGIKDLFVVDFFNTTLLKGLGLGQMLRLYGPNISPVSFAYGVGFFALFLLAVGRGGLGGLALVLMLLCGVKGAAIMVLFVAAAWIGTILVGPVLVLCGAVVVLAAYAGFVIRTGLQIGDYHVIGLMGGWNGFLHAPLGRGIGLGGNLTEGFSGINWQAAQQAGAVEGAAESSVGVLLYQMGVAALVPLGFYAMVALACWRLYARSGVLLLGMAAFGILVVLTNGLFQEEALFAPPAMGFLMLLAGLLLGSQARQQDAARGPALRK